MYTKHLLNTIIISICAGWLLYTASTIWDTIDGVQNAMEDIAECEGIAPPEYVATYSNQAYVATPGCEYTDDETIASSTLDTYLKLGNGFYACDEAIQQFILAHELSHIHEQHCTHQMLIHVIIPFLILACAYILWRILTIIWGNMIAHHAAHIATIWSRHVSNARTPHLRTVRYYASLACICTLCAWASFTICETITDFFSSGASQYMEYRADIAAATHTHDITAPCELFSGKEHTSQTHPAHATRRAYLQLWHTADPYPTYYEILQHMPWQQLCGAGIYWITHWKPLITTFRSALHPQNP